MYIVNHLNSIAKPKTPHPIVIVGVMWQFPHFQFSALLKCNNFILCSFPILVAFKDFKLRLYLI